MRRGGDSYYVLVNNKDEVYTIDDICEGKLVVEFDTWEDAEDELEELIEEEELDKADGWHVERHRW